MNISAILGHVAVDLREVVGEGRRHGPRAAWICLRAHLDNLSALLRERLFRARAVACPCCGWEGHAFRTLFLTYMVLPGTECPRCGAHCRQRMLHLWLHGPGRDWLPESPRILHVAPELPLRSILLQHPGARVLSVDILPDKLHRAGGPALRTDLQRAAIASNSIDAVVCIHVLEHIPDDFAAVHELYRVLRPGGVALIMVPTNLWSPEVIEFGRPNPDMYDHWRDYVPQAMPARLAPFEVQLIHPGEWLSAEQRARHSIGENEIICLCRKPA